MDIKTRVIQIIAEQAVLQPEQHLVGAADQACPYGRECPADLHRALVGDDLGVAGRGGTVARGRVDVQPSTPGAGAEVSF